MTLKEREKIAVDILGWRGLLIAISKGRYIRKNKRHVVVFNANVCTKEGKIWHGDIDASVINEDLKKLSLVIGDPVYILREFDCSSRDEKFPALQNAVIRYDNGVPLFSENIELVEGVPMYKNVKKRGLKSKTIIEKYDREDFEEFLFPKISSLKGSKRASPFDKIFKFMIDKYGKPKAQEIWDNLYWTRLVEKNFNKLLIDYMKRVEGAKDSYSIEKALAYASFDLPVRFLRHPRWAKNGSVYLRKIKK